MGRAKGARTTRTAAQQSRFRPGQRILAPRSGQSCGAESLAEVLQVVASGSAELYRVRWQSGIETFFAPGPDAHDRRRRDLGPPPGFRDRRRR